MPFIDVLCRLFNFMRFGEPFDWEVDDDPLATGEVALAAGWPDGLAAAGAA